MHIFNGLKIKIITQKSKNGKTLRKMEIISHQNGGQNGGQRFCSQYIFTGKITVYTD
jgi:hypothetical protein